MKKAVLLFCLPVFAALAAQADAPGETAPSEASVRELLQVTHAQKLVDGMGPQINAMMQAQLKQALGDQPMTADQEVVIDEMRAKVIALVQSDLKWESFEPQMIEVYEKSFSQQEVDSMLAFYKSDAGQAVVAKMPLVMQNTMQITQAHMVGVMPKVKEIMRETVGKLQALKQNQPGKSGAAPAQPGGNGSRSSASD